ncbi:cell division protein FtsA C-terminal domain-containing protein [Streptococcus infantis]|uniref:cell division protein FtsA C-terminal domain-containing protein n=1 Tax=Streptococcus infantis TaxID=68892 RepID=UPI003B96B2B2
MDFRTSSQEKPATSQRPVFGTTSTESAEPTYTVESATPNQSEEKPKLTDRFRSLIGSMFDE